MNYLSGSIIVSALLRRLPHVDSAWGLQIDLVSPAVLLLFSFSLSQRSSFGLLTICADAPVGCDSIFLLAGERWVPSLSWLRFCQSPQEKTLICHKGIESLSRLKEFPFPTYELINHHIVEVSLSAQKICRTHNNDLSAPLLQTSTAPLTRRAKILTVLMVF